MKKLSALLLALFMFTGLCACSEKETSKPADITSPAPIETEANTPVTEFDFGSVYDLSYSNTTMNIGISLPTGFVVTGSDKLAELNSLDETLMTTNLPEAMKDKAKAYIFVAMDNAGTYMNIVAENLKISGNTFITGTEYFSLRAEETKKELEDMGAEDITLTPSNVYIAGTDHAVEIANYTLGGMECSETRIAFPAGNFMAVMTLKGDVDTILNRIYSLS